MVPTSVDEKTHLKLLATADGWAATRVALQAQNAPSPAAPHRASPQEGASAQEVRMLVNASLLPI